MSQSDRSALAVCTECLKPLYVGDKVCDFYVDERLCEDHAVTLREAISHQEGLISEGSAGPYESIDALREAVVDNRRRLMREGDVKGYLSVLF